jgi:hypothetical protein
MGWGFLQSPPVPILLAEPLPRQPGGFEGFVSVPTVVPLDEAALLHPYGSHDVEVGRDSAARTAYVPPVRDHNSVSLVRHHVDVGEADLSPVNQAFGLREHGISSHKGSRFGPPGNGGGRDLRMKESCTGLQVIGVEAKGFENQLHVLLRHRPPSISPTNQKETCQPDLPQLVTDACRGEETELEAGTVEGAFEPVGKFHVSCYEAMRSEAPGDWPESGNA